MDRGIGFCVVNVCGLVHLMVDIGDLQILSGRN
jgi:hypothetical protein